MFLYAQHPNSYSNVRFELTEPTRLGKSENHTATEKNWSLISLQKKILPFFTASFKH
jgi:hypothetical protein